MNPRRAACLSLLAVLLVGAPAAAETGVATLDALWRKAVAIVGANDNWTAGTSEMTGEERDGRGRARNTWVLETRTRPGPDGYPVQEIVRYVENGRDTTEKRRSEQRGQTQGGGGRGAFSWNPAEPAETPFHPDRQADVTLRRLPGEPLVDGRRCVAYEFEQRVGERERAVGTAWLDAATGAPVRLTASVEPLPVLVHSGSVDVWYTLDGEGTWTVRRFHLDGEVTFLLIRRSFSMDITMSNHWRAPRKVGAAE